MLSVCPPPSPHPPPPPHTHTSPRAGYAKCYCNEGYGGQYCELLGVPQSAPLKDWGPSIGGGFLGGLLVGVLGIYAYAAISAARAGKAPLDGVRDLSTLPVYEGSCLGGSAGSGSAGGGAYTQVSAAAPAPAFLGSSTASSSEVYAPPPL